MKEGPEGRDPRRMRVLLLAAAAIMTVLIALQVWQIARQRRIEACEAESGRWSPAKGECLPGIILQRDIYRL